jgi:hypothetical protein
MTGKSFYAYLSYLCSGTVLSMRTLSIEGYIIGLFVILNGLYVIAFPPVGDEPQGYAIIAIGIFIIIVTQHLVASMENNEDCSPP